MRLSTNRILTTHVGSLPRPPELRQLLVQKDQGEPHDKAELDRLTRQAVVDIVRRQAEAGVDIVNDGEMSKPGYSTYIADRLSGFSGHEPAKPRLDTREHPNFVAAYIRHRHAREASILHRLAKGAADIPTIVRAVYIGLDPRLAGAARP